ncbi:hypothetical protein F8280_11065 [Micromonospora noduli]|uniref:hypothetical protein n=1 Tax=Micromonospora noduli TaxID=709876 RepID=UPI00124BBCB2|nr:hypothetical protein [Micromonospora noduli]KAB1925807.1 hypothetical protein F8280_11065 [Micromonospora noduli]
MSAHGAAGNHERLAQVRRDKWEAVGVLDDASNCLTLLGEAVSNSHTSAQGTAVLWSDESVVCARRALTRTIDNLRDGGWAFRPRTAARRRSRRPHEL